MKLRSCLLSAAVVPLLAAAPSAFAADLARVPARAPVVDATPSGDGFVSVAAGGAWVDEDFGGGDTFSTNGLSLEGAASGEYNFTTTLGFQGDVVFRQQDLADDGDTDRSRTFDAAAHAFYRTDEYLLGGIVQAGTTELGTVEGGDFGGDAGLDHSYAGLEGQYFLGDLTLYGQAAVTHQSVFGNDATGAAGTLELRYFLTPNFKIEGHVAGTRLDFESETADTLQAGASAEYRFDNQPFSIFAKYDFSRDTIEGEPGSVSDNRVLVGLKFNLGTQTLKDRDRSGASLKPFEAPSQFFEAE